MASVTKYYAWVLYNSLGTEGTIKTIHRIVRGPDSVQMERFDPAAKAWVHNPGLEAVSGVGGDHPYEEISRENAIKFLQGEKPTELAGQF